MVTGHEALDMRSSTFVIRIVQSASSGATVLIQLRKMSRQKAGKSLAGKHDLPNLENFSMDQPPAEKQEKSIIHAMKMAVSLGVRVSYVKAVIP